MNNDYEPTEQSIEEKLTVIRSLKTRLEDDFVTLGQLLSELKRGKVFKMKGFKSFRDFIEEEFNFSSSLANKLIGNYELFIEELDIDEVSVKTIGLDTLNLLKPIVKECSYEETEAWIEKAQTLSKEDLREDIKLTKERKKEKTLKDVYFDQFRETMTIFFNCSQKELLFKLALYFQDADLEAVRSEIKKKQRVFEDTNNPGGVISS
jgi:hypothetical protein